MARTTATKPSGSNDTVTFIALVAGVIGLIAYFVFMGNHYLAPPRSHLADSLSSAKFPSWLVDDAKQCQGDYSKLNPAEQQKIISYTKASPHDASNEIALVWAGQQ